MLREDVNHYRLVSTTYIPSTRYVWI